MIRDSPLRGRGQWNMVEEHQRQQQLLRDQLEKEDEQRRKLIYRDELQKLMDEQRMQRNQDKSMDIEMLRQIDGQLKQRDYTDVKKLVDAKIKAKEFIGISLDMDKQKKQREYEENMNNQEQERQITLTLQRKEQQDQYNKMMNKDRIKQDLTHSHQLMEQRKQMDKHVLEQSEREIYELEKERLRTQEIQRNDFLERLRSGYGQNQSVLQKYNQIYDDQGRQKKDFLQRFIDQAEEKRIQDDFNLQAQANIRNKLKKDTLSTIMHQIDEKQLQAQVFMDQKKYDLFNLQTQQIGYRNRKQQEDEDLKHKKLQYQKDLRSQMLNDKERRFQEGQMSAIELDLNKRHIDGYFNGDHVSQISAPLPGITSRPDFERQKQTDHLDLQLHIQQPNNYILMKRQRNLSAYQEANSTALSKPSSYSPQKNNRSQIIQGY